MRETRFEFVVRTRTQNNLWQQLYGLIQTLQLKIVKISKTNKGIQKMNMFRQKKSKQFKKLEQYLERQQLLHIRVNSPMNKNLDG